MMTIPHRNFPDIEGVSQCKSAHFFIVAVGHQEIASERANDSEQFIMVNLMVCVEPSSRFLIASRVGWINKEHDIRTLGILS